MRRVALAVRAEAFKQRPAHGDVVARDAAGVVLIVQGIAEALAFVGRERLARRFAVLGFTMPRVRVVSGESGMRVQGGSPAEGPTRPRPPPP